MGDPISFDETGRPRSIGGPPHRPKADSRIVCGARCTWWDDIGKVGVTADHSLPCCPHCGGVLYEFSSEAEWFAGVDSYEKDGHPGYRAMMEWARGRCFQSHEQLIAAYARRGHQ